MKTISKILIFVLCATMIATCVKTDVYATNFSVAEAIDVESNQSSVVNYANGGTWIQASNGKWWYRHSDGTYTTNDWEFINGNWYYFDNDGYRRTGWLRYSGDWYYLNENGIMQRGWVKVNDEWYYLNEHGVMQTGWLEYGGNWYYLDTNGKMFTGWVRVNYKWYYFNIHGVMQTGWNKINGYWYYFNTNGVMQTGWKKISGYWYYLLENGRMNTDDLTLDGRSYTFYSNGRLLSTEILITRQGQQMSNWCWAASSVMIGTYNTNSTKTQSQIVTYIKGSIIDAGANDYEVADAIDYASNNTKSATVISTPLSFNNVVSNVDSNKPFFIHMQWYDENYGHAIVGAGYNLQNNTIYVIDPWGETENTYYDYTSLKNGTVIKTGYGYWFSTVTY